MLAFKKFSKYNSLLAKTYQNFLMGICYFYCWCYYFGAFSQLFQTSVIAMFRIYVICSPFESASIKSNLHVSGHQIGLNWFSGWVLRSFS